MRSIAFPEQSRERNIALRKCLKAQGEGPEDIHRAAQIGEDDFAVWTESHIYRGNLEWTALPRRFRPGYEELEVRG